MSEVARNSALRRKSVARRSQQGFTLIELSIVLTIIGLIVGGVLKGQELLNNARLKTQMAQIDAIKSATYTFQDRYLALPGDYTAAEPNLGFTGSTANGNGDGNIASLTDSVDTASSESEMAWADLVAANLLGGLQLPPATLLSALTQTTAGLNFPGKLSGSYAWMATFTVTPVGAGGAVTGVYVRLQGSLLGAGAPTPAAGVLDASTLDNRYDDGSPATGSIITTSLTATTCNKSGAYNFTAGNDLRAKTCVLMFQVQ